MLRFFIAVALLVLASPALAIDLSKLSPTDHARVDRQCDVLRFRQPSSLGSEPPEPPAPGQTVTDPSSYWANSAAGIDTALSKVNLDLLTIQQCREAGFYKN